MILSGKSDIGKKRQENQDYFFLKDFGEDRLLAVVCDGMGGVAGGREASRIAVNAFVSFVSAFLSDPSAYRGEEGLIREALAEGMEDAVSAANDAVLMRAREDPSLRGMGTTLVAVLLLEGIAVAVNVGDSRLYRCCGGEAFQVTRDHALVQYMVDIGKMTPEEARISTNKNVITRAVGVDSAVDADTFFVEFDGTDRSAVLLLCSDGLSNMVPAEEMAALLAEVPEGPEVRREWLTEKNGELIALANENGGPDNITAVLITA